MISRTSEQTEEVTTIRWRTGCRTERARRTLVPGFRNALQSGMCSLLHQLQSP